MSEYLSWLTKLMARRRTAFIGVGLVVLTSAALGFGLYAEHRHQQQVIQSARVQARVVADSLSGALAFGDQAMVEQITTAIRANPDVEAIAVFDDKGLPVAHYGQDIILLHGQNELRTAESFTVRVPVQENGVKLGAVITETAQ